MGSELGIVDAYATAGFVLGDAGLGWLAEQPGVDGIAIDWDGHLAATATGRTEPGGVRWRLAATAGAPGPT